MVENDSISLYKTFKQKGPELHTAKAPTIAALIAICKREKPKRVLELGGGIGTITFTLLLSSDAHVDVYEQNDFCRKELQKNLKGFKGRFTIVETYRTLPPKRKYDLVVIDGGEAKDHESGYDKTAWLFMEYLSYLKIVYIEGRREDQRSQVKKALSKKGIFTLIRHRNIEYEGVKMNGGLEIRFIPNTIWIVRMVNYFFWELLTVMHRSFRKLMD